MAANEWQARVEGALSAHFKQPDGPSRAGTDYRIGLKRREETHTILVRAYLSDDLGPAARKDTNYQAQTVIGYVFDRLDQGWLPNDGDLPFLTILNPKPGQLTPEPAPKRGLFARLLRR